LKIAITGASGHIGVNLCKVLINNGHHVKALLHKYTLGIDNKDLEPVKGEIGNISDLEKLFKGCEVVFHLAAHISLKKNDPLCVRINVENCKNIIQAARNSNIRRIIHFSSIHAFVQEPFEEILNESRSLSVNSKWAYDRSKAQGQQIMLEASGNNLEILSLNPTAVIGPYDYRPSFLGNAIIRFYKGQNPGLIPGGYNWVDVRDVCSAAVSAIHSGKPGECYLLGGSWHSIKKLASEIHINGGHPPPKTEFPVWLAQATTPVLNLHAFLMGKTPLYTSASLHTLKNNHQYISSEKAAEALNYQSRPFSNTIAETINWFRDNNYL